MNLHELFDKWDIQKTMMATKIKMLGPTFRNKFSPNHPTQFSTGERARILNVLRIFEKDLHDHIKQHWISDQEKEKICPGCSYEKGKLEGNTFSCPQCGITWLAIHQDTKLL